jgi:hypothetical protein
MNKKKRYFPSFYFFPLIFFLLIIFFQRETEFTVPVKLQMNGIDQISLNGKILSDTFIGDLQSLQNLRPVSYSSRYFDQMGLSEDKADLLKISYMNGSTKVILTGQTKENNTRVYIRFEGSETIYEASGSFLNILNEKEDPHREFSLLGKINLTSIIAIELKHDSIHLYLTENGTGFWIDQISGTEINRLKIQNVINKILNLQVMDDTGNQVSFKETDFIRLETIEGQEYSFLIDGTSADTVYILDNINNKEYKVIRKKVDFLGLKLIDLK